MVSSRMFFILHSLMLLNMYVAQSASTKPNFPNRYCDDGQGNFTANGTYQANLNRALSGLIESTRDVSESHGFYNSSYGQTPDRVHAAGLCRGDADLNTCRSCLGSASAMLTRACPGQRAAIGGLDQCVLHYSNRSSSAGRIMESYPRAYSWDEITVFNYSEAFFSNLTALLSNLSFRASVGGNFGKYSTGFVGYGGVGFQTIYALAQCTPDLLQKDCSECLEEVFVEIQRNYGRMGGRVISPSCNFRYEVYRFYGDAYEPAAPSPSTNTTAREETNRSHTSGTSGVVVTAAAVVLIISAGVYTRVKKTNNNSEVDTSPEAVEEIFGCVKFKFSTIKAATNNFSERNKIGRNIFGAVYKGKLHNGQDVAVKTLELVPQDLFKNEVRCCSLLCHPNLVRLVGFCSKGDKRFLVYEFLPMRLDRFIFDRCNYILNWDKRYEIIKGIASAVDYLHRGYPFAIIHGDIRLSKVMLDLNLNPQISCFAITKYFGVDQSDARTTRIVGAVGYIAPEYIMGGVVTVMSDVYSFGVLLLEIVSGRRSGSFWREHEESFTSFAGRNWREGTLPNLIDPRITYGNYEFDQISRCIYIGLLCVQVSSSARPTMNSVVSMLSSNSVSLPILSESGNHDISIGNSAAPLIITDTSDSFVSASEISLSPISEITSFRHDQTEPNSEFVRPHVGVIARVRRLQYGVMRSLFRKLFANSRIYHAKNKRCVLVDNIGHIGEEKKIQDYMELDNHTLEFVCT